MKNEEVFCRVKRPIDREEERERVKNDDNYAG